MSDPFAYVSEAAIKRYSERYQRGGYGPRALGWGSREQQVYRFDQVLRTTTLQGRSLLDIGCGFGDFYGYATQQGEVIDSYIGWDLNMDLIEEARRLYLAAHFDTVNISARDTQDLPVSQLGVMLGLLNFNLGDTQKNLDFTKHMMERAFAAVTETLVVDFLSTHLSPDYPKEDAVFYHQPSVALDVALSLTSNVKLFHDYLPIPQKEFMLVLEK